MRRFLWLASCSALVLNSVVLRGHGCEWLLNASLDTVRRQADRSREKLLILERGLLARRRVDE